MSVELISFDICPYVQRSTIALSYLNVPYDIRYVDLANKPDWFLAISPRGKVPVLNVDEGVLFESMAILEYLNESVGQDKLLPADPFNRARVRAWAGTLSDLYGSLYMSTIAKSEDEVRDYAKKLRDGLALLEDEVTDGWFTGEFGLIECVAGPIFQRAFWMLSRHPDLGFFDGIPRVKAWADRILAEPALAASVLPDITDRFEHYSKRAEAFVTA